MDLTGAQVLVYQPQINSWTDNQLDFRAALALKQDGSKDQAFGVIFATTRTQVDKVMRTVVFENLQISKIDFPTLPNRGANYGPEFTKEFAAKVRTMSLDKLEASLAANGIKPAAVEVNNAPPQVIISNSPAILVPIDGAPVMKTVPSHPGAQRVINTRSPHTAGRPRRQLLHPRLRRLALGQLDQWSVVAGIAGSVHAKQVGFHRAAAFEERARSTC